MSYDDTDWAAHQCPRLATEKLVLYALAYHRNKDTGLCCPSMEVLAIKGLCHKRSAIRAIESLSDQGFISITKAHGKPNRYTLLMTQTSKTGDTLVTTSVTSALQAGDTHVTTIETPATQTGDIHVTSDNLALVTPVSLTGDTHVIPLVTHVSPEQGSNKEVTRKYSEEDYRFAEFMAKHITPITNHPINLKNWSDTIRLIRERDKKTHKEMCQVFLWANNDTFWRTNILSPDKLRKQYGQLFAKMTQEASNGQRQQPNQRKESAADLITRQAAAGHRALERQN